MLLKRPCHANKLYANLCKIRQQFKNRKAIYGLLNYLARLSIQLCLRDKAFPITYFLNYFCESTTT